MFKPTNKKGVSALETLGKAAIALVVVAIVLVVGFLILAQAKTQLVEVEDINESNASDWSLSYNATSTLQSALDDIPTWMPIFVIVIVGGALLGLIAMFGKFT